MAKQLNRRSFLRTSVASGAILALPRSLYRSAFGQGSAPSERIRLGFIGVGGQGTANLKTLINHKAVEVAMLCDVDRKHLGRALNIVETSASKPASGASDYRKLLDEKTIDAVVISTPDHWHALQVVHACQAGKDVYCEKPLTLTVREGQAMVDAAAKAQRVVQTGSQQRSAKEFRTACELVRSGAIGDVHTVKVGLPKPNFRGMPVADSNPPEELDYDFWVGPAPERPYNEKRVHYLFRFFWDYSGGQQTNFGAHHYDIAQWGLGTDDSGPVEIRARATYHKDGYYEVPETTEITYKYANGITMLGGQSFAQGTEFLGSKGSIYVTRGKLTVTPEELAKTTITVPLQVSNEHHANWLACIKSRQTPIASVAIGHRSATVCHLGNIAVRTERTIRWNPETQEIVGDNEAAKMLSKEYRTPWTLKSV